MTQHMMQRVASVLAVLSVAAGVALPAQQTPREQERQRDRERVRVAPRAYTYTITTSRGVIGITPDMDANPATDSIGARLSAVTPGGPAAQAGVQAGDIITKYNGVALGGARGGDEDLSGPAQKLLEAARRVEPGDTVKLEYRRGRETKTVTMVAQDRWSLYFEGPDFAMTVPTPDITVLRDIEGSMRDAMALAGVRGGAWAAMELVMLNPDLGEYFGTREGVLVVKAPADTSLGLRSGDVILSVAGRKPTSTAHLMRILRSYEPGETVSLEVMRRQRRTTLTGTIPAPRRALPARTPRPGGPAQPLYDGSF